MELLKALGKTVAVTFKRLYDILATYLLFWVVYVASVATAIHFLLPYVWEALGVVNPQLVWQEMANSVGLDVATVRLGVFAAVHLVVFLIFRRPIEWLQPHVEKGFDKAAHFFDEHTSGRFRLRAFGEIVFSIVVTALLVPFVLQPTLVRGMDTNAWLERGANLIDGSAVIDLPDSVVGYYRQFTAEPVVVDDDVDAADLDAAFAEYEEFRQAEDALEHEPTDVPPQDPDEKVSGGTPLVQDGITVKLEPGRGTQAVMDRWDDHIWEAVDHDPELFAYVKAFMYVESAGRQYAVSHTGCLGLMQFCSGTAKSPPYRQVFGTGQVYACGCQRTSCKVERDVQRALESGEADRVIEQEEAFPCELTDARFDPDKAIGAGRVYIDRLHRSYGGNIYLMYIGYNSGPAVANKVWKAVGQNPDASLAEIDAQLVDALRPYYGDGSTRRARGLVNVHLPKIKRAYLRYGEQLVESQATDVAAVSCESNPAQCSGLASANTCVPNRPERPVVQVVWSSSFGGGA